MDLLAEFDSWLRLSRRPKTVHNRVQYIRRLESWCATQQVEILTVTTRDLSRWVSTVGSAPATRKNAIDAINVFYKWAAVMGLITGNPAQNLPKIDVPAGLPQPTPDDVLREGVSRCEDVQDLLMLLFACFGGLRVAEIAALHTNDIEGEYVRVHGKGGKIRHVPLHPVLGTILHELHLSGWIFPSSLNPTGHYLADSVAQRIRKRLLPGSWSAHTLRHRFATEYYRHSPNLLALRELLGHANVSSTMIYTRVSPDALAPQVAQIQDPGAAQRWSVLKQAV